MFCCIWKSSEEGQSKKNKKYNKERTDEQWPILWAKE